MNKINKRDAERIVGVVYTLAFSKEDVRWITRVSLLIQALLTGVRTKEAQKAAALIDRTLPKNGRGKKRYGKRCCLRILKANTILKIEKRNVR